LAEGGVGGLECGVGGVEGVADVPDEGDANPVVGGVCTGVG